MEQKIHMSELLFLGYWGLMLFAKGIGLYDGQIPYKIILVLSIILIIVKMCITKYSYAEWAIMFAMLVWSSTVYLVSGEKGILICMITVVAMKNVSVKRAFSIGLCIWSISLGGSFLYSLINIDHVQTAMQTKNLTGAVLRYFMGQPHPNVLHISYLVLAAMIVYCVKETYNWKHLLLLLAGNLFLFLYSYSFTGAFIVTVFVILAYYVRKRKISKFEYILVWLFFPICLLFSIGFPLILKGRAYELADKIFNNRINFARQFLIPENMTVFGKNLASITTDIITMDNSFVFALVTYGIPIFLLICFGYWGTISKYIRQNKNIELAIICCFFVAGITEPFLFNTSFKNLTLIFIGEQLFLILDGSEKNRKIAQKEFAIFKNADKEVVIPLQQFTKVKAKISQVWISHKKRILAVAVLIAILAGGGLGISYQPSEAVLKLQQDNLLIFERVRVTVTALLLGFVLSIVGMLLLFGIKNISINRRYKK